MWPASVEDDRVDRTGAYAVIGAGPHGLSALKALLQNGIDADGFEREAEVGGNWNFGAENSRVYQSTHLISSKPFTQFPDFPMPDRYPDYPSHAQIKEYFTSYARHFGLHGSHPLRDRRRAHRAGRRRSHLAGHDPRPCQRCGVHDGVRGRRHRQRPQLESQDTAATRARSRSAARSSTPPTTRALTSSVAAGCSWSVRATPDATWPSTAPRTRPRRGTRRGAATTTTRSSSWAGPATRPPTSCSPCACPSRCDARPSRRP